MATEEKYQIDEAHAIQLRDQVENLRGGIVDKAHYLVHVVMPQRVVTLSDLYNVWIPIFIIVNMHNNLFPINYHYLKLILLSF